MIRLLLASVFAALCGVALAWGIARPSAQVSVLSTGGSSGPSSYYGLTLLPYPPPSQASQYLNSTYCILDQAVDWCAFYVRVPKSGTLDGVEFSAYAVVGSSVRVSFQDVSLTTGLPDTVVDQFVTVTWPTSGVVAWRALAAMTSDGTAEGAKRAVTAGDLVAVVIQAQSEPTDLRMQGLGIASGPSAMNGTMPIAYYNGTSASRLTHWPYAALRYTDGTYGQIPTWLPVTTFGTMNALTFSGQLAERSMRVRFPKDVLVSGMYFHVGAGTMDPIFTLYDQDSAVLERLQVNHWTLSNTNDGSGQMFLIPFTQPRTLKANTTYRLAWANQGTSVAVTGYQVTAANSTLMSALPGGAEWFASSRTAYNTGAWTDVPLSRPLGVGLVLGGW